ncbi:sugar ABC transporter ATP-binding protein [Treponema primitia]|uniref:sugar ABC transporter ATP-binding protein n=1 Tax=Treponema primitia TaxID=88058 RepID=UPI00025555DE|nr:sugar ABC transporter ATP-binding protein [Treponema primitia]
MAGQPVIQIRNMHKTFPGVHALKGVDLDLYAGEVHALVGENGAGKSTLIKIISGAYTFTEGTYLINGQDAGIKNTIDAIKKGISVIYQELNLVPSLSIAENIFFGRLPSKLGRVLWSELYANAQKYLEMVGLSVKPTMKVQYLSVAQQQLVEIAKSLALDSKVIIMDEPTSALSPKEIKSLFEVIVTLREKGVCIMYVSHKLEEIFELADRISVFRDGARVGAMLASETDQQRLIEMMVGRKLSDMFPEHTRVSGETVLEVKGLTTDKVTDLNFHVRKGEIVGFSGLMGAGRSEMTRGLFGADKRSAGKVFINGKEVEKDSTGAAHAAGMGLVTENRKTEGLLPNLSVKKNITIASLGQFSKLFHIFPRKEASESNTLVDKLRIKTPSVDQLITKLSGGNQQKVLLSRWLMKENLKLLIIDEPTRGIDVGAKSEIYNLMDMLAKQGLAILMVSSELPEILGMCDRIYVMKNGKITGEFNREDATETALLAKAIS